MQLHNYCYLFGQPDWLTNLAASLKAGFLKRQIIMKNIYWILFCTISLLSCKENSTGAESNLKNISATSSLGGQLLLSESGISIFNSSDNPIIKSSIDELNVATQVILASEVIIPEPVDAGGGYSHEKAKSNYADLYKVAISNSIDPTDAKKDFISEMFIGYAAMYPKLGLHPKSKKNHPAGKLYWQGLNEAVTLFYFIQSYDLAKSFIKQEDRIRIEKDLLVPMAKFLSEDSYEVFNKIHNHGTWSVAAVGMTGMVLGDNDMVNRSIYGSNKDSKTGFLAQLDALFSSDGFYSEGPYYHRYAILPFIAFAEAIENNRPDVKIFDYRDGILQKAVTTLLQLTDEQGRFYPINDAIKSKTWESDEVVFATNIAYNQYKDESLLPVIKMMDNVSFTDAGASAALAINKNTKNFYERPSLFIADGVKGDRGGLALMRSPQTTANQLQAVLKFSTQGMGHGHFDRLSLSIYDHGNEVIPDYGAARFLNIEAKRGGRYLPENKSYARHTIAHATVTVDEKSQNKSIVDLSEENSSQLIYQSMESERLQLVIAADTTAYEGVDMTRSITIVNDSTTSDRPFIIDIYDLDSATAHQYDYNFPFYGDIIDTQFDYRRPEGRQIFGTDNGYEHLEVLGKGSPLKNSSTTAFTFLQEQRFYTITTTTSPNSQLFITQTGANDPDFNLNIQRQYLVRERNKKQHTFVSIIEPHGFFNPIKETVAQPKALVENLTHTREGDYDVITFKVGEELYLYTLSRKQHNHKNHTINYNGSSYSWEASHQLIKL